MTSIPSSSPAVHPAFPPLTLSWKVTSVDSSRYNYILVLVRRTPYYCLPMYTIDTRTNMQAHIIHSQGLKSQVPSVRSRIMNGLWLCYCVTIERGIVLHYVRGSSLWWLSACVKKFELKRLVPSEDKWDGSAGTGLTPHLLLLPDVRCN